MNIHDMVSRGNDDKIAAAIEAGADVNALDEMGRTPMMLAIEGDQPDCLATLLSFGADPRVNWPKPSHCSWSRALAQPSGVKLANTLLDSVDDPHDLMRGGCPQGEETTYLWSCLFKLNRKGAGTIAQRLIDWGLDPNERLNTGMTPLLIAAHKAGGKTLDVIDVLLAAGADPTASTEPNLSGQRQREAELDAMQSRGQDVSLLPRVLPHTPASVLDLAKSNGKKTYEYLKSILDIQGNQDRYEVAESQLAKIRKSKVSSRFTKLATTLAASLGCEAKPVRKCPALLQYSVKLSSLPPADNEGESSDFEQRLEPLQAAARSAGAMLIYQKNVSSWKAKVNLLLVASDDWAVAVCASKTSAPNYGLKTRNIVNRLAAIYEPHPFELLGCAKSFVTIRFKSLAQPLDLHNELVRLCPDFADICDELTEDLAEAYGDGARCFLWWD